ncbi:hypothetical protein Clacol_004304 [Clathrus columnatus]|uniref:Uncharacterized protein n=1 Tax=Clathrus columnatus TaxID=1419009 RepID=A0AAV5ABR8_9AGAM|nr:hypothetical protein Clacol_004304 [Clathrus columnatus]
MTIALLITFVTALIAQVYVYLPTLFLIHNVAIILLDVLAFLAAIRQFWGLWQLKRSLRLQGSKDFATLLFKQGVQTFYNSPTSKVNSKLQDTVGTDVTAFQNVLSLLLICEFTLDLRRRNTKELVSNQTASNLELPTMGLSFQTNPLRSIQSVFGRLHESIMTDMGERSGQLGVDIDSPGPGPED